MNSVELCIASAVHVVEVDKEMGINEKSARWLAGLPCEETAPAMIALLQAVSPFRYDKVNDTVSSVLCLKNVP